MDSIILQIVLQLPTIALLIFAGFLFRGLQREKANLEDSRMLLEAKLSELHAQGGDPRVKNLEAQVKKMAADLDASLKRIDETRTDGDKAREYMNNQKTALKEFGRVLSRTSEQTYSDLQSLEEKVSTMRRVLEDQGFEFSAAA
ncbi:MAG: hypothetical protein KDD65_18385 [Bacteroidetes bacterium]|nr:hypothetical protein [Bacteroidota bacterium]